MSSRMRRIGINTSASQALAGEAKFLSGHFCWSDWVASLGPTHKEVVKITLLRKPVDQLSSHLRWLDHYNLPQTVNERSLFPEDVLNEIDHIGRLIFNSPDSVDAYLINLSEVGTQLFDNCQSRYFVARLFAPMNSPIHTDKVTGIKRVMSEFNYIGRVENISLAVRAFSNLSEVGLPKIVELIIENRYSRQLDTSHTDMREVLGQRTAVDDVIYQHIVETEAASL